MTSIDKDNIGKLTDDELFKTLKELGLSVGPITSTTRSLYERRLKNHLEGNSTMSLNTTITTTTTTTSASEANGSPKKSNPSTPKSSPTSTPRSSPSPKRTGKFLKFYQDFRNSCKLKSYFLFTFTETTKVTETLTTSFVSNDSPTSSAEYLRIRGRAPMNRKTTQSDEIKSSGNLNIYSIIFNVLSITEI